MKSRLVFIFVFYFVLIPIKTSAEGNSTSYIADSDYLSYRLKVTLDALNDPVIKKLLESGTSVVDMGKLSTLIKAEIESKLKIYRDKHNLDENGAKK